MQQIQRDICFDIEATNLLNGETIDYTAAPFKLKPFFKIHCGVIVDMNTNEVFKFVGEQLIDMIEMMKNARVIAGHNIINFDLLALKMYFGIDYDVRKNTFCGRKVKFMDTLVLSKMLNPDRPGHSLEWFGNKFGFEKIDWRGKAIELGLIEKNASRGAEFAVYHEEMLTYCVRDVELNVRVYHHLMREEWGTWDWKKAFEIEMAVADIITRQSHRGFAFNSELAVANVRELDELMEQARQIVEPHIPPKKPSQAEAKAFCPPKIQVTKPKKKGEPEQVSAVMRKWVEKHKGTIIEATEDMPAIVEVFGERHRLPMQQKSFLTEVPAKVDDTTHIKGWFVELGWEPSTWKERDLTVDTKKRKLSTQPQRDKEGKEKPSQWEATVDRYLDNTYEGPFCRFRLERLKEILRVKWSLKWMLANKDSVRAAIMERGIGKPLKVYTNPQITVGQDKEICPNLEALSDRFEHTKEITQYLTYKHRRNSILGGGFDPDELDEDGEPEKGYMASVREDGRIPTPADTCGAGTSRFKHRLVANIPRVTSLFGRQMRDMFGCGADRFQIGYDFDSLEAKIEAHYCWIYDVLTKDYCNSLTAEKPNDIHTVTASKISEMIGQAFSRGNAKSVKYGCSYGAQAARVKAIVGCDMDTAQEIFDAFWEAAKPLAMYKKALTDEWKMNQNMYGQKFITGIDGRKIPTRSEHALVNSSFQSAGVICAKLAMVLHDDYLKEEGLSVDFFVDNWKEKSYCQQMIAYHK